MLGRCHIRSEWSRQLHRRADICSCASASPPINTYHSSHCHHRADTSIKLLFGYEPSGRISSAYVTRGSFFLLFLLVLCCAMQQCFPEGFSLNWLHVYSQTKVKQIHKTTLAWLIAIFLIRQQLALNVYISEILLLFPHSLVSCITKENTFVHAFVAFRFDFCTLLHVLKYFLHIAK